MAGDNSNARAIIQFIDELTGEFRDNIIAAHAENKAPLDKDSERQNDYMELSDDSDPPGQLN